MGSITVEIDGKKCEASEGEFILNIARREDIFIPALCYLTKCSPTLACRLCLVEADGKRVYSCNAKAKDGMVVATTNEEIEAERESIMRVYDVNHPLQCGVCDKSGECELQNYTLLMRVNEQKYAIKDTFRPIYDWGKIKYDAGLCIVCEKCVTVCKDMIGEAALKTIPRGGEALDKSLKESMPKDSYAMWNKLQKSIIGVSSGGELLDCQECGECIEVCPVGALASSDFQYKANAWELKKIPAANPHSSDCTFLYYETKHGDSRDYDEKIFRVTNEHHYASLSGAARFGFDFENRVVSKDRAMFDKAVDFISSRAKGIKFNSYITNEEALILQKLKERYSLKLINEDALRFQNFLKAFRTTSSKSFYSGTIDDIKEANFIISVGSHLRYDAPSVGFACNNGVTMNKGAGLYFHPLGDSIVDGFSKNILSVQNRVGSEEHVLAFVLEFLGRSLDVEVPNISYDSALLNLPDDYESKIEKMLAKKDKFALIIGEDTFSSENSAKIAGLIDRLTDTKVVIIPSQTNTLGVANICDLDESCDGELVGYNEVADFTISALGGGDLDTPALNQQEGTFTNIDKRVIPTNAALKFNGYTLNCIANALGITQNYTIDYTKELPQDRGYMPCEFDTLSNYYDNGGVEHRGYELAMSDCEIDDNISDLTSLDLGDEVVYRSNPINQFNYFTNRSSQLKESGGLYVSRDYLESKSLNEGDHVLVGELEVEVKLDNKLTGLIPYLPTFDKDLDVREIFGSGCRFSKIPVRKV
jgi:NADH-quinone oxidoreductase subunit G